MRTERRSEHRVGDPDAILVEAWSTAGGIGGWFRAVNHKVIGRRFVVTAFLFLLAGGIEAMLMRSQLIIADNDWLSPQTYNEIFTLHGSTMMFLFAVPIMEGLGMYFVPLMLGTRDLPFPRMNAFGYWCYLFGGLFLYASIPAGDVPDGGWFAYVPLTGPLFSPSAGLDFWLLGVSLLEVSAIIGAIELIYVILRRRAPGMSLDRVPVFAWAILVMSFMILFAFPVLLMATTLLEVERQFGTALFDPGRGGDPLLWQHLFWIFGHPEVYIMFLPAAGIASMVIPTFAGRPLAGYSLVVAAIVATGVLSFGLWVHHMFAVGLGLVALSVFAAASAVIAIPNGVQVFAWITTIWRGRPRFSTPMLYMLGFLVLFVLGGITGVMVASVPFDEQVHDSYFVVAHFHYVLVGAVVFPAFGGLHYWWPKLGGGVPSEAMGRTAFWTMFVGFNVAFFPQHIVGLLGMPRRVYTYEGDLGWGVYNLLSSIGAYVLALGVLVFAWNLVRARMRRSATPDDPWGAASLEWAAASPPAAYNFRELPVVASGDPLWDAEPPAVDETTAAAVRELASPTEPVREVLETTTVTARAESIARLPGPSWWPLLGAGAIVVTLLGALLYREEIFLLGLVLLVAVLLVWGSASATPWHDEPADAAARALPPEEGRAGVIGMTIGGAAVAVMFASLLFSYFDLLGRAEAWPPPGGRPPNGVVLLAALLVTAGAAFALWWGRRALERDEATERATASAVVALIALVVAAALVAAELTRSLAGATASAYGSIVAVLLAAVIVAVAAAAGTAAVAMYEGARGRLGPLQPQPVRGAALVTWMVLVAAAAVFAALWITPRVTS